MREAIIYPVFINGDEIEVEVEYEPIYDVDGIGHYEYNGAPGYQEEKTYLDSIHDWKIIGDHADNSDEIMRHISEHDLVEYIEKNKGNEYVI